MRILSMQGKIVWDILQRDSIYYADPTLTREDTNYSEDIKQLNGKMPIWGFAYPCISFYTMYNGDVLEYLRCEMSLPDMKNCWDDFVLFELEIPKDNLKTGLSWNACSLSVIFPELSIDMVKAVYLVCDSKSTDNPYYKTLTPLYLNGSDTITTYRLDCYEAVQFAENDISLFTVGDKGKCLRCNQITPYTKNNKHYCCLDCMWSHQNRFEKICSDKRVPTATARNFYNLYTDIDFSHGSVKLAYKLAEAFACKDRR